MGNYLSTAIRGNRGGNLALGLARPRKRGTPNLAHQASLGQRGVGKQQGGTIVYPGKDVLFGAAGCILWSYQGQNGNPG